jgi:hypothetical protein
VRFVGASLLFILEKRHFAVFAWATTRRFSILVILLSNQTQDFSAKIVKGEVGVVQGD